jgi:DNA-binding transcriptional MerR regulator
VDKAPGAFRTISEVADEIDVPQHVLRFWESRFAQIRPMKRGGGRRFYRPEDVDLLRGVRHLLYGEGYTIRGAQRILREQGAAFVQNVWRIGAEPPPPELEEDRAGDDSAAPSALERPDPDVVLSSFAASLARERDAEERPGERREPGFAAAPSSPPSKPAGFIGDDRRKLRAALDELLACHRLIEAALVDEDVAARAQGESPRSG